MNIIEISKIRNLLFIHKPTNYLVLIPDFKLKDVKLINRFFDLALLRQMLFDKVITEAEFMKMMPNQSQLNFYTTDNDRSISGKLSDKGFILN